MDNNKFRCRFNHLCGLLSVTWATPSFSGRRLFRHPSGFRNVSFFASLRGLLIFLLVCRRIRRWTINLKIYGACYCYYYYTCVDLFYHIFQIVQDFSVFSQLRVDNVCYDAFHFFQTSVLENENVYNSIKLNTRRAQYVCPAVINKI